MAAGKFLTRLSRLASFWPLIGVIVVGLAASALTFRAALEAEKKRVENVLALQVEARAKDLQRKIEATAVPLEATAIFVTSQEQLDLQEFLQFAAEARTLDPSLRTLSWAPRVRKKDRAAFEAALQAGERAESGIFEFTRDGRRVIAGDRDETFPLWGWVAQEGISLARLIGYDYASEPHRWSAAERARDEGRAKAVPLAAMLAGPQPLLNYIVFRPVFSGGMPADVEARRERLQGYVIGTFHPPTVLATALTGAADMPTFIRFQLMLSDPRRATPDTWETAAVYSPVTRQVDAGPLAPSIVETAAFTFVRDFEITGQQWRMEFFYGPDFTRDVGSGEPYVWLMLGLLLTGGVAGYLERERWQLTHVRNLVDQRTSDLREAANKLQALIDSSPLAIVGLDTEARVINWNEAAERTFGYTAEEMLGQPYRPVREADLSRFEALSRRIAAGEPLRDMATQLLHKDGHVLDIMLSSAPLHAAERELAGAVLVLEDVTEKLKLEAKLSQAQKMEAVGQLTGGIAHDFNNILTVVVGSLDRQIEILSAPSTAGDTAAIGEAAKVAMGASLRGAELIQRLLAFSRNQPLHPRLLDLGDVVLGLTPLLQRSLGEGINIESRIATDLWPVLADPSQLENAVLNLAINARDAMEGNGRLVVACTNITLDETAAATGDLPIGDFVALTVSDSGAGIPPDILPRVFEPFFTTKSSDKGTGLGLSMVYGYARQSGGTVKIYSEPGHGTDVRIYLPRAARTATETPAAPEAIATAPTSGREHILVVEDKTEVREIAVRLLRDLGYRTTEAGDATTALLMLEATPFDLLFTDLVMPGKMTGYDLAVEARRRFPSLAIIFTSGFSEPAGARADFQALGATMLGKPYRKAALAAQIRAALDRRPIT